MSRALPKAPSLTAGRLYGANAGTGSAGGKTEGEGMIMGGLTTYVLSRFGAWWE